MPNAKIGITRFVAIYDIRDVQGGSFCTPLGQTFPLGLSYRKSCKERRIENVGVGVVPRERERFRSPVASLPRQARWRQGHAVTAAYFHDDITKFWYRVRHEPTGVCLARQMVCMALFEHATSHPDASDTSVSFLTAAFLTAASGPDVACTGRRGEAKLVRAVSSVLISLPFS